MEMYDIAEKKITPAQKIEFYEKEVEEGKKQRRKGYQEMEKALTRRTEGLGSIYTYAEKIKESQQEMSLGRQKIVWAKREQRKIRRTTNYCKALDEMIKDEETAQTEYQSLIERSKPETRKIIEKIKEDEGKHYELLKKIKQETC